MICGRTKFPKGTTDQHQRYLAISIIFGAMDWNYLHGTGHGVGIFSQCAMNHHKALQLSFAERGKTVHEVGMLLPVMNRVIMKTALMVCG